MELHTLNGAVSLAYYYLSRRYFHHHVAIGGAHSGSALKGSKAMMPWKLGITTSRWALAASKFDDVVKPGKVSAILYYSTAS